jgi:hypothetical protein
MLLPLTAPPAAGRQVLPRAAIMKPLDTPSNPAAGRVVERTRAPRDPPRSPITTLGNNSYFVSLKIP